MKQRFETNWQTDQHLLVPDYEHVAPELQGKVEQDVRSLLQEPDLYHELQNILSADPNQSDVEVIRLLDMKFPSEAASIATSTILECIINRRWQLGVYILHCDPKSMDLSSFNGLPKVDYEFMPTQVLPDSLLGGVGKLLIKFPKGAMEAEKSHTHPGARIIYSTGPGRFNSRHVPSGAVHLEEGTVALMPKKIGHNFAAYPERDWTALSFHLPYVGTGKEAMEFEKENL